MASIILIIIIFLWLIGFIQISYLHTSLFTLFQQSITLYNLLLFLVIAWIIEILPSPFRYIVFALFLLWILSILGIIAFSGFSQLVIAAIIIGVIISLF